jgi:hypothetical protein
MVNNLPTLVTNGTHSISFNASSSGTIPKLQFGTNTSIQLKNIKTNPTITVPGVVCFD